MVSDGSVREPRILVSENSALKNFSRVRRLAEPQSGIFFVECSGPSVWDKEFGGFPGARTDAASLNRLTYHL